MADDTSDPGGELNLTSSTGKNDPSSPWGSILGAVNGLANTAGSVYKNVAGTPKPKTTKLPTWLVPVAIGGVALLVVMVVVVRR